MVEANALLHGQETQAWGDTGYQGAAKRPDAKSIVRWNIAMRPGKRKQLDKTKPLDDLTDQLKRIKASIRAKIEHPFRVITRQFVRAREGALPGPSQEYRAVAHALCAVESLDGAR